VRLSTFVAVTFLASTPFALGCHRSPPRSPAEEVGLLGNPDWKERRSAADGLRDHGGPPAEALPALYAALQAEQSPKVLGAILITLGASGIPEVRPFIDARVNDPDEDMRRWARRALKYWLVKNQLLGEEQELPPPPGPLYGPPAALAPGVPGSHPTPGIGAPAAPPAGPPPGAAPPPAGTTI
jgi:hypothetical protein